MVTTFENLTGKLVGTLRVKAIARRKPDVAWSVVCTRCNSAQVHRHTSLQNGFATCGNASCGRSSNTSPSSMSVASGEAGIRTADSTAARAFEQSQQSFQTVDPQVEQQNAQRTEANRIEAERLREQYKKYFFHQLRYPDSEPMSLQQWFDAGDTTRARILAIISKDESGSA